VCDRLPLDIPSLERNAVWPWVWVSAFEVKGRVRLALPSGSLTDRWSVETPMIFLYCFKWTVPHTLWVAWIEPRATCY
jgi:hypothetical protein